MLNDSNTSCVETYSNTFKTPNKKNKNPREHEVKCLGVFPKINTP